MIRKYPKYAISTRAASSAHALECGEVPLAKATVLISDRGLAPRGAQGLGRPTRRYLYPAREWRRAPADPLALKASP